MQRPTPATPEERREFEVRVHELWLKRNRTLRAARDAGALRYVARWVLGQGRFLIALGMVISTLLEAVGLQPPVTFGLESRFASWLVLGAAWGAALAVVFAVLMWRHLSNRLFPHFEALSEEEQRESGWSRTV